MFNATRDVRFCRQLGTHGVISPHLVKRRLWRDGGNNNPLCQSRLGHTVTTRRFRYEKLPNLSPGRDNKLRQYLMLISSIAGRYFWVRRSSRVDNLSPLITDRTLRDENVLMLPEIYVRSPHRMDNCHRDGRLHISSWMDVTNLHDKSK